MKPKLLRAFRRGLLKVARTTGTMNIHSSTDEIVERRESKDLNQFDV